MLLLTTISRYIHFVETTGHINLHYELTHLVINTAVGQTGILCNPFRQLNW